MPQLSKTNISTFTMSSVFLLSIGPQGQYLLAERLSLDGALEDLDDQLALAGAYRMCSTLIFGTVPPSTLPIFF